MPSQRTNTSNDVVIATGPIEASALLRGGVIFELWALDEPEREYLASNGTFSVDDEGATWSFVQTSRLGTVTSAVMIKASKKGAASMVASFATIRTSVLSTLNRQPSSTDRAESLLRKIDESMENPAFKHYSVFASDVRGQCTPDDLSFIDFYYTQHINAKELQANPKRKISPRGEVRIRMSEYVLANVLDDAVRVLNGEK